MYIPTGLVLDRASNAVWGMQFIWPFKADFRIVYLDAQYTQTIHRSQSARLRLDHGAHAHYRRLDDAHPFHAVQHLQQPGARPRGITIIA